MSAHREGVWTGHDAPLCPLGPDWRRLGLEAGGLLAGATALAYLAAPFGLAFPMAALALGFGTFGLMGRHADDRKRQAGEPVQELREEFGNGPVWKVEMMVRQGEAPTGCDRGLIWVEAGRIVYSGLRTSFALAPSQARGTVRHSGGVSGQRFRLNLLLARDTPSGPLSLSFWPIAEGFGRADNDAADLRFALNRVLNHEGAGASEIFGQWPPVTLGPEAPPPRQLLIRALMPHMAWSLAAVLVGLVASGFSPWVGIATFAVAVLFANWGARFESLPRWQAWRDAQTAWRVR